LLGAWWTNSISVYLSFLFFFRKTKKYVKGKNGTKQQNMGDQANTNEKESSKPIAIKENLCYIARGILQTWGRSRNALAGCKYAEKSA